jgi:hypothetical protein
MPADNAEDIQMKQKRTTDRLAIVAVLLLAAVPISLALCKAVIPGAPPNGVEDAPCTGICTSWVDCPGTDSCGIAFNGGKRCVTGAMKMCNLYNVGMLNWKGCCTTSRPPVGKVPGPASLRLTGTCILYIIPINWY